MNRANRTKIIVLAIVVVSSVTPLGRGQALWELARQNKELLTISTLFTAQNVRAYLSSEEGLKDAIDWCRKTGGGWFDPYGTHEQTYVEQARQTVLADAREMLLFCYGSLLRETGPANVEKLRTEIPGLFQLAKLVRDKPLKGIDAPKPPNSDAYNEQYVYDFVGMLGLPLVPTAQIDAAAPAAFLPVHALKDSRLQTKLARMLAADRPVLVTDGLASRLATTVTDDENLLVLEVKGNPRSLLELTRRELKPIRDKMLAPFRVRFDAPNKVALYLIGEDCVVVENFNDEPVAASLEFAKPVNARKALVLPADAAAEFSCEAGRIDFKKIGPRTLVALTH